MLSMLSYNQYISSLNLNKIKNDNVIYTIKKFLYFTLDKFYINEFEYEDKKQVILEHKDKFIKGFFPKLDLFQIDTNSNIEDILDSVVFYLQRFIQSTEDQMISIACGHIRILKFYIQRCKQFNTNNPYEVNNIENNFDIFDKKYFTDIDYLKYKNELINMEYDLLYDSASCNFFDKILQKKNGRSIELPQELFLCVSIILSKNKNISEIREFYNQIAKKKISLATPIITNLRTLDFKNNSSCYIMKLGDKLSNIFSGIQDVALISSLGGGVGVNLSSIRPKGSVVRKRNNVASGILSTCKLLDVISSTINQGGKRSAAITVALDIWHLEIIEFLEINLESGDNRMKCFDIFPQVVVNDIFMRKVRNKESWYLLDPKNIRDLYGKDLSYLVNKEFDELYEKIVSDISKGKNIKYKVVPANDIMKKIIIAQIETGLPYIFFKDTVNKNNPNINDGKILSGNLCQESFTNFGICNEGKENLYHTCNLLSLNMSNILDTKTLEQTCKVAVSIMNSLLRFDNQFLPSKKHNDRYRTIGIGVLGLHDHLAFKNMFYGEDESVLYIKKLFHMILYFTYKKSIEMSKYSSPFPAYEKSLFKEGIINGKNLESLEKESKDLSIKLNWKSLFDDMKKYGIFNSHILAIAPNTSSSIIQNSSASVLPIHSEFFIDNNSHSYAHVFPRYSLNNMNYYVPYSKLPIEKVIKTISQIQDNIDQGISFELIFDTNENLKASYIKKIIFLIWESNCKTIYYTRTLQKSLSSNQCESCSL